MTTQKSPRKLRTIQKGVYVLENGLYEVWQSGRYVGRTKTESEALELKEVAKESGFEVARDYRSQTKLRKRFEQTVAAAREKNSTDGRRKKCSSRPLFSSLPKPFRPDEALNDIFSNGGKLPMTYGEWTHETEADCSLISFAKGGIVLTADKIEELCDGKHVEEIKELVDIQHLMEYLEEVRETWVWEILKTAQDCVHGQIEKGQRSRFNQRAVELIEFSKLYFEETAEM